LKGRFGYDFKLGFENMLVYIHMLLSFLLVQILICVCCMCQIMSLQYTHEEEVSDDVFSLVLISESRNTPHA